MKSRQDLERLFNECKKEILKVGIPLKDNITIELSDLGKRTFGRCRNKREILISYWAFESLSKDKIKNTIIHELLHTTDNTKGHCSKWKYYAGVMNREYGYEIKVKGNIKEEFMSANKSETEMLDIMGYKYRITCKGCENSSYRHKMGDRIVSYYHKGYYTCRKCRSTEFKIEDIKLGVEL